MEVRNLPECPETLLALARSSAVEGFFTTREQTAGGLISMLSAGGIDSDVKEHSRGFYVKINTSVNKSPWLPDDHLLQDAYIFKSSHFGPENGELGSILMNSFLFTLMTSFLKPRFLIFMSEGVLLTVESSPVLSLLTELETEGVEIMSCRTSLEHLGHLQKLRVGKRVNMIDIIQTINNVKRVITL